MRRALQIIGVIALSLLGGLWFLRWITPPTHAEVSGAYTRSYLGVTEDLTLHPDGTFQQIITYTDGRKVTASGQWSLINQAVGLSPYNEVYDVDFSNGKTEIAIKNPPDGVGSIFFEADGKRLMRECVPVFLKQRQSAAGGNPDTK